MRVRMAGGVDKLDWALVNSFLAVAETGSLSAASRVLELTQPTVGRQIKQMEAALGFALFDRQPRGLKPTEKGLELLVSARAMREGARQFALAAAGASDQLSGTVRITASVFTAHKALPDIIAGLRRDYPEIQIEIVPTDSSENLLFREADIALRMYRSEQLEIVTRKIGEIEMGIYGARSYIDRVGFPETIDDLFALDFIGYDRSDLILTGMKKAGVDVSREWFPVRCDHHSVYFELLRSGCGVGFSQVAHASKDPNLVRIDTGIEIPSLPIWLAAHETVRRTPRVAVVWDRLVEALKPFVK